MAQRLDTVIIGGGAMGSATAWSLARRGHAVTLLEQFEPGHKRGASHGATRNLALGYADPSYLAMLAEALPLWSELEAESARTVFAPTGIVNHGPGDSLALLRDAVRAGGFEAELLAPEAASERWAGIRFDTPALHFPQGGQLNADAALPAFQAVAAAAGAEVRHGARVTALRVVGDDEVRLSVETADGTEELVARTVVVTAGAWTSTLLDGVVALPRLTVTQEQPAHFAVADADAVWPGFNHRAAPGTPGYEYWYSGVYGMLTPGEGVKAGWHAVGAVVHPDRRDFTAEPAQLRALQRYAREWLPGVDADAFADISCTYTLTDDENFVLDRIGPVVVGAGFSGHGFKFTPVVGRILADLVLGTAAAPELFSAARPRAGSVFRLERGRISTAGS
jgi:sarcosine oxidase